MDKQMTIRDYILAKIINHEFSENKKLPSENEIANQFHTTRNNVRKVYDSFEEMGYLYSKQGVGRFLIKKKPEIELQLRGDIGFSAKMVEMDIPYESQNIGIQLVSPQKTKELHQKGLTGCIFEITRLRKLYGKNSAIHRSFVSKDTFPDIENEGNRITSIFNYYREKGFTDFQTSGTSMSISFPTMAEMDILQCGSLVPLVVLETDCQNSDQTLLEITHIIYRSDLFKYRLNV